ncbi:MAG TPA: hypothetical protein VL728_17790 [Cyclobacteriaceae bacterium]|jgi:signal transduction histidine kinase|nr:hypothetical protein [Cyclobacteriaceae bacterium]
MHPKKPIEALFLESLLKLSFAGVLIVMAVDFFFNRIEIVRTAIINFSILFSILLSFVFYKKGFFTTAVLVIGFITMAAMYYQSITADNITTSSMAVVMVIGFGFSVLLKGRWPIFLHVFTLIGMIAIFTWLGIHPQRYSKPDATDIIIAGVTYVILYTLIVYSSLILKQRYDDAFATLESQHLELIEKSNEIETQNEELVQSHENLNNVNMHLESLVHERTKEVQKRSEQLIRFAYSNAHDVRGPVARVLGLIQLSKMEADLDYPFLFKKIEEQTKEIDEAVKGINRELEKFNP